MEKENWTLIIKPNKNFLNLNFKELWRYKDLILLFVRRDFVAKYKQTILGPLWFIIQPLLTTVLFTLVFGKIAKLSSDGIPHILFYLSGVVAWNYFSAVLKSSTRTFISYANMFSKVYFPRLTVPISSAISNLIQFAIQFAILVGFIIYYAVSGIYVPQSIHLWLIPYILLILAFLSLGFGIIFSSLTAKYRDLIFLLDFGVQLWMYITPIIYPMSQLPEKYKTLIILNPVAPLIESFRYALLGKGTFNVQYLLYSTIFAFAILFLGMILFNRVEKNFIDTV